MPKQNYKSTEVLVDGGLGGVRSVTVDGADYTPDVFATDWLSVISLPARPNALILDMSTGVLVGSIISHSILLIGALYAPIFSLIIGGSIVFTLMLILRYVSQMGNKWYTLSAYYRLITLILGMLTLFII